jgi:hypothetical protein
MNQIIEKENFLSIIDLSHLLQNMNDGTIKERRQKIINISYKSGMMRIMKERRQKTIYI